VQDEVKELEEQLLGLDAEEVRGDYIARYNLHSRRWDVTNSEKRKEIIEALKLKLKEYDDLVLREREMLKIQAPRKKDYDRFTGLVLDERPLDLAEADFVCQEDDMIDLASRKKRCSFGKQQRPRSCCIVETSSPEQRPSTQPGPSRRSLMSLVTS
jgi:hypothetical protein